MKKLILVLICISSNALAEYYDSQSLQRTPNTKNSIKTIVNKDGSKTITDGDHWIENVHKYKPPVEEVNPQPVAPETPQEHVRKLMETGGIGGAVEARIYMDAVNSGNSEYQQQHEIRKMRKDLQNIKTQRIIDSTKSPY